MKIHSCCIQPFHSERQLIKSPHSYTSLELTKNPVDGFSAGLVDDDNIFLVRNKHKALSFFSKLTVRD